AARHEGKGNAMSIQSINPTTGEVIESFVPFSDAQIAEALSQAHNAFTHWRRSALAERAALLHRVAKTLRDQKTQLARSATLEIGKPIIEGEAEVEKCAGTCAFSSDNGESFLSAEPVVTNAAASYVSYRPLGVVLAVMPWNFPYWQVFRFAAPALMAG